MLSVEDIEKMEKEYFTLKLNRNELKSIAVAITNQKIRNEQKIEELKEIDEIGSIDLELENQDYCKLSEVMEFLLR